ncbi:MAG: glycosyltransferase family 2 protein [Elusimicrobia bacterium]|nr:glycosyltransferase family 2 protein [Elusimicrobiota bacterium]
MVSIIVLVRNRWADTRRCLRSVRRHTPQGSYELLLYDNHSSAGVARRLERLAAGWPQARLVRNDRNLHFALAINRGMESSRGSHVVWLNNDTVVGPGWLERLLETADSDASIAAVGPMTNNMAPPEQLAAPFSTTRAPRPEEVPFLGGFCFLVKRRWAERAGRLDERFEWGWEDIDYCMRLRHAGGRLVVARNVFVRHAGNRTIRTLGSPRRRRIDLKNRRLILRKWNTDEPLRPDLHRLFHHLLAPWERRPVSVSVLVPYRGEWDDLRTCLSAMRRASNSVGYEVLAVDASGRGTGLRRIRALAEHWPELKALRFPGRRVLGAINLALREAASPFVALVSPQARPPSGWLDGLLAAAHTWPDAGAFGPISNGRFLGAQFARRRPAAPPGEWRFRSGRFRKARLRTSEFLRGFCLLVPRATLDRVGRFDDRLDLESGVSDLCLRIRQSASRLAVVPQVYVPLAGVRRSPSWRRVVERWNGSKVLFDKWAGHPLFRPPK